MGWPVEVVFATSERCWRWSLTVENGATVGDALRAVPLAEAGLAPGTLPERIGIFGHEVEAGRVLRPHDRVEIYRPLLCDPKAIRRERAERERLEKPRPRPQPRR